ncbi:hypothetical protein SAMN05421686_109125 [Thalassolituus maritimus]|uniref:Uncharacterized protein n=1 Tax=Thalassolituus maritimus TaxID=484498 RepID=A0A1N7PE75_9GAMM|nr:hypothetical protein SAMN05421686_109125 [Thalassolituus maritimus]
MKFAAHGSTGKAKHYSPRALPHTNPPLHPPKVVYNPTQTTAVYLDLAPLTVKIADNPKLLPTLFLLAGG